MNRFLKNAILRTLYVPCRLLGNYAPRLVTLPTLEEANEILRKYYKPRSTKFDTVPALRPDSKDFSVVVPVYNSERYLRGCLLSLIEQQTKYDYEVICVNDGSTDGSLAILDDLKKVYGNKLKVCTQENGGISAARNKGIELAQGKYIGFVDNDDMVSPDYVEKLVSALVENNADMVQCGHRRVRPDGTILYEVHRKDTIVLDNDHTIDYIENLSGFVWAGAYRKSMFEKTRFNVGFWFEDMITKVLLGRQSCRSVVLCDCLYNYTLHEGNASDVLWKATAAKALDQLFLPMRLFAFSNQVLGLPHDAPLDGVMIHELCWQLPNRSDHVGKNVLKAAFVVVADFMRKNNIQTNDPRNSWNKFCKAVKSENYLRWKYTAKAEKWKSKIV